MLSKVLNISRAIVIPNLPGIPFFCLSGQIWDSQFSAQVKTWSPYLHHLSFEIITVIWNNFNLKSYCGNAFNMQKFERTSYLCLGYPTDASQDWRLTFLRAATQRQSRETMTSVLAGHIILTSNQPVGSRHLEQNSNPPPRDQELLTLPTELLRPPLPISQDQN